MKNLESVVDTLKEINEILKETNIEMLKCLNGGKKIIDSYYVIAISEQSFLNSKFDGYYWGSIRTAIRFVDEEDAKEHLETIVEDRERLFATIQKVKTVVEND